MNLQSYAYWIRCQFLIGLLVLLGFSGFTQGKFDPKELDSPKRYGDQIAAEFERVEVSTFKVDTNLSAVYIKNGLRSSTYINPEDWLSINDKVSIEKISVVFSKYPIRNGSYKMNYPLLCNRLKRLFQIDPLLNDSTFKWEMVLQTNCVSDTQVDSLYHGVVIYFKETQNEGIGNANNLSTNNKNYIHLKDSLAVSFDSTLMLINEMERMKKLPDHVKKDLEGRTNEEKLEIIIEFLEAEYASKEETNKEDIDQEFLDKYESLVSNFVSYYQKGDDDAIQSVFERNPQWKNALVVADWTGSMYQYGSQALHWHILNFKTSGLTYFTLFNDGDRKFNFKKIGETGGIYHEKANNVEKMLDLYQLVMMKGGGGDLPENDIEALIKGIEHFEDAEDIILIADNNSCVRDIELLNLVTKPVHVIVCGYTKLRGLNPQYIQIAEKTGGSIHTIEFDLASVKSVKDKRGIIKEIEGNEDLKVGLSFCHNYVGEEAYLNMIQRRKDRARVKYLRLEEQDYVKVPLRIRSYKSLNRLDLSHNRLSKIKGRLKSNKHLRIIDLSYNEFEMFPKQLAYNRYLREIYINNNKLDSIWSLRDYRYLQVLDLSHNELSFLPDLIRNRELEKLYISHNQLKAIPISIKSLRSLKQLDLSYNQLTKLPKRLNGLKDLEIIDLSYNQFSEVPLQLAKLRNVKMINLQGNPLSIEQVNELRKLMPKVKILF